MKILIVEDEKRISHYLKKGLQLNNHIVDTANDGQAGLDLALVETYDLIILDRMLPHINGLEICRTIRKNSISTPILMLTAKTEVEDRVEGLNAGADDYLGKPFAFSELLARINALSRRPKNTQSELLAIDNLSLNPTTLLVKRGNKKINLSRKEFALLEFLLRHPNQVFSSDQITQNVWDYDSDVLPNTAQVYIGYLRKKIDKDFPQHKPLIHTIRGFGYKISQD